MQEKVKNALELEVHKQNEFNKAIKLEIANVLKQLVPFVGKKIFTLSGNAKGFNIEFLRPEITPFKDGFGCVDSDYLTMKYKKLVLVFRTCMNGGQYENKTAYTQYTDRTVELGEMDDSGKLLSLFQYDDIIASYGFDNLMDVEQEVQAITAYLEAKKLADTLQRKIKVDSSYYRYL